ncbi:phosphatidate cytidylyltransferase [Spirochaetia bacterium]|nr:phosphatidate cytidylyltransferase [Spirochaetia bacterium]GHV88344.1 phosphatidate cytidylyltransferase [Spirochaetia bacterium]
MLTARVVRQNPAAISFGEIKTEVVRKTIHFFIALSPGMAAINRSFTVALLMAGTLFYACMECFRLTGIQVPMISRLTKMASRSRDDGRFVLGPVTLGIGALLALLLYPSPAAAIAIYALAFGDGFASLVGKLFGAMRPPVMMGKSLEGSAACFVAVLISAFLVSHNLQIALVAALVATLVEALPLGDYDNIAIPVTAGFAAQLMLYI